METNFQRTKSVKKRRYSKEILEKDETNTIGIGTVRQEKEDS